MCKHMIFETEKNHIKEISIIFSWWRYHCHKAPEVELWLVNIRYYWSNRIKFKVTRTLILTTIVVLFISNLIESFVPWLLRFLKHWLTISRANEMLFDHLYSFYGLQRQYSTSTPLWCWVIHWGIYFFKIRIFSSIIILLINMMRLCLPFQKLRF